MVMLRFRATRRAYTTPPLVLVHSRQIQSASITRPTVMQLSKATPPQVRMWPLEVLLCPSNLSPTGALHGAATTWLLGIRRLIPTSQPAQAAALKTRRLEHKRSLAAQPDTTTRPTALRRFKTTRAEAPTRRLVPLRCAAT